MKDPRNIAQQLAEELRKTFGEDVRSVVLFGSIPRGEAIPGVSDLNVLVLFEEFAGPELVRAAPLMKRWIRAGNTPPLLYSVQEWSGMRDTFAIELADMQDAREVLSGSDPVTPGSVSSADLRLHAEHEMRETILHLRLRLLLAAQDPAELGRLLLAGLPSFTAYMRALLRLSGEQPGVETLSVIHRAAERIGADAEPIARCWETRRDRRPLTVSITDSLTDTYSDFIQRLVYYIDQLPSENPLVKLP